MTDRDIIWDSEILRLIERGTLEELQLILSEYQPSEFNIVAAVKTAVNRDDPSILRLVLRGIDRNLLSGEIIDFAIRNEKFGSLKILFEHGIPLNLNKSSYEIILEMASQNLAGEIKEEVSYIISSIVRFALYTLNIKLSYIIENVGLCDDIIADLSNGTLRNNNLFRNIIINLPENRYMQYLRICINANYKYGIDLFMNLGLPNDLYILKHTHIGKKRNEDYETMIKNVNDAVGRSTNSHTRIGELASNWFPVEWQPPTAEDLKDGFEYDGMDDGVDDDIDYDDYNFL